MKSAPELRQSITDLKAEITGIQETDHLSSTSQTLIDTLQADLREAEHELAILTDPKYEADWNEKVKSLAHQGGAR